ncbi:hypothetical protein C5S39_03025 [Candidatus Methanophagaceae archaeon]|nr:hypothetical protein C5S39_03025 [Methanophagales archaeon]
MDKTLRTIREEVRKNREGNIPLITLVVDTNILAYYGWKRDDNVRYLFNTLAIDDYDDLLIIAPKVSKIEFKAITKQERTAWLDLKAAIESKLKDISRYEGFENLYLSLNESRTEIHNLISSLDRSLHEVLEILSNLMLFFEIELPLQDSMAFYISKDPDYGLVFEDALVFSFVKLVGKALDGESKVLFLTKDSDFDVDIVQEELRAANVAIYFNSGECLQRIEEELGRG